MAVRRATFAGLLLAAAMARAQAPAPPPPANANEAAKRLAERLGEQRNADGLREILESRNVDLISAYDRGMRHGAMTPRMPADVEALLARFYDDPVVGAASRVLSTWDHPQTRAYCDRLVAEWRSGEVRRSTYPMRDSALKCDAPGIEAEFRQWIVSPRPPSGDDLRSIVYFLGSRHDADAIPLLARMDLGPQLENAPAIVDALFAIGTPASAEAGLARLAELKRIGGARAEELRRYRLQRIAAEPEKVPFGYATFRRYEPEAARASAAAWLSKRKDAEALDDTFALLSATPPRTDLVSTLIATDDVAVWKRARESVEKLHRDGAWDDDHYRFAAAELDRKLADPQAHFARREIERHDAEYRKGLPPIYQARNDAAPLKASDPSAWFAQSRRILAEQEALASAHGIDATTVYGSVASEINGQYWQLGEFARFRLKRPDDAVAMYAAAARWGNPLGEMAVADTQQWDLADKPAALAAWNRAATQARARENARDETEAMMSRALARWAGAQAAWLAERRLFRGDLEDADLAMGALVVMFGIGPHPDGLDVPALHGLVQPGEHGQPRISVDRPALAKALRSLPPSGAMFLATVWATQFLPDAGAIRAHLERMDPAGYGTAVFFAIVERTATEADATALFPDLAANPSPRHPLRVAARQFLAERGIHDKARRPFDR